MQDRIQHVLICYGGKSGYYHGAKYQILRNFEWYKHHDICVVTDQPHLFENYPVKVIPLTYEDMRRWSLEGQNHFGIKINGLLEATQSADSGVCKSILLDTDMFWTANPENVAWRVQKSSIIFYEDEGQIFGSRNKSIQLYENALRDKEVDYALGKYSLTSESRMWRSSLIGIHHEQQLLKDAFDLFQTLSPLVPAHTIEQFSLGEIARIKGLQIREAKKYLNDWSSIGRKNYATPVLNEFFSTYGETDFSKHLSKVEEIKINRPARIFL